MEGAPHELAEHVESRDFDRGLRPFPVGDPAVVRLHGGECRGRGRRSQSPARGSRRNPDGETTAARSPGAAVAPASVCGQAQGCTAPAPEPRRRRWGARGRARRPQARAGRQSSGREARAAERRSEAGSPPRVPPTSRRSPRRAAAGRGSGLRTTPCPRLRRCDAPGEARSRRSRARAGSTASPRCGARHRWRCPSPCPGAGRRASPAWPDEAKAEGERPRGSRRPASPRRGRWCCRTTTRPARAGPARDTRRARRRPGLRGGGAGGSHLIEQALRQPAKGARGHQEQHVPRLDLAARIAGISSIESGAKAGLPPAPKRRTRASRSMRLSSDRRCAW